MPKVIDIKTKMNLISQKWNELPEHIKRGLNVAKNMDEEDLRNLFNMLGTLIIRDVEQGLKGEPTEFLFEKIDALYEQYEQENKELQSTCHFCGEETDTGVCLECLALKLGGADKYKKWRDDAKGENS